MTPDSWNASDWNLMVVHGRRAVRGNAAMVTQFGAVPMAQDWPAWLGSIDEAAALAWLADPASQTQAYVAKVEGESGRRWWRLRVVPSVAAAAAGEQLIDVEDVTEEREAFERVRLEGQHFHALIERSAEGISLFDTGANIIYESPSNKRIHGWESGEMEGKNLFDFCHPDDMARAMPRFEHLAKAPGIVETEVVRFKHKDGHWIYLEGTVINATDDPRVGALVNNFRDVTARLDAEREVRKAKDAAEEAQRLQQHFLTNLSHEFKTPLTLIRGPLVDLAEGRIAAGDIPAALARVMRNVDRLNGLITELIDLSRLDAGTFALQVNRYDLVEFVRAEADTFSGLAASKAVKLDVVGLDQCSVYFDATKLEKVVTNLLSNALRYSPENTRVQVAIDVEGGEDDEGTVKVEVTDRGPGMDEKTRARVFERFFQADTTLSRNHEGMGVGLALAREMVEMHGGKVGVESEPGEGSTFWFILPLGCDHFDPDDIDLGAVREPRPHTVGSPAATARPVGLVTKAEHRPRLLLVEDNEDMRAYLRMNLDPYYSVTEALDGRQAWDALEMANPEIIISDVMMPHVDGLELCRRLKGAVRWRDVPVILLSAKGSVDHRVEGLKAGANDYMAKPFSVTELLQRLRSRVPWGVSEDAVGGAWCEKLEACVAANLGSEWFDVRALASELGYGERQLRRRTMQHYGLTPSALILQRRLAKARELILAKRHESKAEVAHAVGLSPGYFTRRYRSAYPN